MMLQSTVLSSTVLQSTVLQSTVLQSMTIAHRLLVVLLLTVPAGCATQATRAPTRLSRRGGATGAGRSQVWWARNRTGPLEGRVAVSKAGKAGSGRIDWGAQGSATRSH